MGGDCFDVFASRDHCCSFWSWVFHDCCGSVFTFGLRESQSLWENVFCLVRTSGCIFLVLFGYASRHCHRLRMHRDNSATAQNLAVITPFDQPDEVHLGSFASLWPSIGDFRSTPVSGHHHHPPACPKGANRRSGKIVFRECRRSSTDDVL